MKLTQGELFFIFMRVPCGSSPARIQVNLIRKESTDMLKIKQQTINAPLSGLNNSLTTVKRKLTTLV